MSLDDFAQVGVHEYQHARLRIPGEGDLSLYFRGRRENPPFVWLEFGTDVRRVPKSATAATLAGNGHRQPPRIK